MTCAGSGMPRILSEVNESNRIQSQKVFGIVLGHAALHDSILSILRRNRQTATTTTKTDVEKMIFIISDQ